MERIGWRDREQQAQGRGRRVRGHHAPKDFQRVQKHVASHGFTVRAVTEMGYSAALATLVPRCRIFVEHFVDECDSRLSLIATTGEDDLKDLTPEEKMVKVIGWRLDMLKEHAGNRAGAM